MVPVRANEGWGKVLFHGPHPPSAIVPPLSEGEGYSLDDRFCDSAFGSAQNDSIGGDVLESNENKGRVQSCACGVDSDLLALPACVLHANMV